MNGLVPFVLLVAPGFALIALEPDLGTAGVYIAAAVAIFFMAGANLLYLGAITGRVRAPPQELGDHAAREVGNDTHTFARALRAALREDPDVILVGEMRDPETVQFALSIAETGHLVFATLHTNDAPQSLDRISDMFPSERQNQIRVQLAACLAGVVSQRLDPAGRRRHGRRVRAAHRQQRGALARPRGQDAPDPQRARRRAGPRACARSRRGSTTSSRTASITYEDGSRAPRTPRRSCRPPAPSPDPSPWLGPDRSERSCRG